MKRITTVLILSVLLVLPVFAEDGDGDGGVAGAFRQVPIGARPTAMGGAYRSISDDGAGPLFNPAGASSLSRPLFATSYRAMQLDRSLGYLTLLYPAQNGAVIGFNWLHAGSGSVETRNQDGDLLGEEISQVSNDLAIIFAKRFEDFLSIGARMAYLHSKMGDLSTFTVNIDLGLILYVNQLMDRQTRDLKPIQDIQIGLTVKNVGSNLRWDTGDATTSIGVIQEDKIPIEIGLGLSARFFQRKLVLATDIFKNTEQSFKSGFGTEYFLKPEIALRAGFTDDRLSAGAGYMFAIGGHVLAIDYAFTTDKADEGSEHIFSFDLLF